MNKYFTFQLSCLLKVNSQTCPDISAVCARSTARRGRVSAVCAGAVRPGARGYKYRNSGGVARSSLPGGVRGERAAARRSLGLRCGAPAASSHSLSPESEPWCWGRSEPCPCSWTGPGPAAWPCSPGGSWCPAASWCR